MRDFAIKAEKVAKLYHTDVKDSGLLRDQISRFFKINNRKNYSHEFWALKDISFEIRKGEAVGIIGKNGAGKSTLLKILSRITQPTNGRIVINGRVASLLEVGTGFHQELTGRENIFMNGSILGMKQVEIRKKFDEIVDFSGVEKFIDVPVKHYSSGMYVRLAFAVAAYLEPEILIVDEVLAVGDAEFQKKCLGKMNDVTKSEGKTILFVSHSMPAVRALCSTAILLDSGSVVEIGAPHVVIEKYLSSSKAEKPDVWFREDNEFDFQLISAQVKDDKGLITRTFSCDDNIVIDLLCFVRKTVTGIYAYFCLLREDGTIVLEADSYDDPPNIFEKLSVGEHRIQIHIPRRTIGVGRYTVYLNFSSTFEPQANLHSPKEILSFEVIDIITKRGNNRNGFFSPLLTWKKINQESYV
jgi:lipopolysaccharide transport system ATP-binding protein